MDETEPPEARTRELLIVTGMSGAGRSTVANVLEDSGWYVIDNLPPQMLVPMAELLERDDVGEDGLRLAAVVDVRSRAFFTDFRDGLDRLRDHGYLPTLVFVDATDESLVRRFESVRRPHPLQDDGRMLDGIIREREMLRDLRANADLLIDTSGLNVHQLTAKIQQLVGGDDRVPLRIAVMSFGFKYGLPLDADMVFDMRFLPNPYWDPALRPFTGKDAVVADFVLAQPGAQEFVDRVLDLLEPVTAGYLREGRSYVTLAVGCTGGKHRSVAMAEELGRRIQSPDIGTVVVHRDLGRE
ncbi:UPF0042 nucleotide-binding protein [Barrientosiimonas humi]|uniref:UPF0042 nucleotide-binding protein n=2 Tax=Barrientosiimonas TaxID=1535207 RepID=A0A542XBS4_9MICO|nr:MULTISPECIES: RNase adapter RapZ [Barrientosiimonas]TQL33283.1 UPF0042 nucleotide-binding protein [Barrientosiimonas humi]BDZ58170.1 nucleotide-binding protein [Barrientosiimonas endolithica]CAG7573272.1 Nucleotide-binding protein [Barrientosiimonas humi]